MKVTRIVFVVVFSIICVFLLASASSIYTSAENDLKSVTMDFEHLIITNKTVSADFQISASNNNELPSTFSILNHNLTVNPYSSTIQSIKMPLNVSALSSNGWPVGTVICYVNAVLSEFISGIGLDKMSRNISALLPSVFSKFTLSQGSSNDSYNLVLNNMISVASSFMTIGIYEGSHFLGNLSSGSSTSPLGGNTTFSGILGQSGLSSQMRNLSMEIFGMKINL